MKVASTNWAMNTGCNCVVKGVAYAQMISTQQLPTLRSYASGFVPAQAATDELDLDQLFGGDQDVFKF